MDIEFQNLKELYDRLEPALSSKLSDLKRNDYEGVTKKDIWNYLTEYKWKNASGLSLHQMVSDILNTSNSDIYQYSLKESR